MLRILFLFSVLVFNSVLGQSVITLDSKAGTSKIITFCHCGTKDGSTIFKDEQGKIIASGNCLSGKKDGKWMESTDSTEISCGKYKDDLKTGKWVTKNKNITIVKGNYKKGEPDGRWKYFYPTGKIAKKGKYNNGMMIGTWSFYSAGGEKTMTEVYH